MVSLLKSRKLFLNALEERAPALRAAAAVEEVVETMLLSLLTPTSKRYLDGILVFIWFIQLVLNSKDIWLVEFFAPWCGHCKNLEPHWKAAASELKGKVKLGALDATVHTSVSNKFGIRGFPTIKYFAPGSDASDALDYDGGRTTSDIVSWASAKAAENMPAPEVLQGINEKIVEGFLCLCLTNWALFIDACKEKQLCIFAFLPHILDCQSKCRNDYLATLKELSEKHKKNQWGWIWLEAGAQPAVEEAFEVGGFGYPAMAALNYRKMKYAQLKVRTLLFFD